MGESDNSDSAAGDQPGTAYPLANRKTCYEENVHF